MMTENISNMWYQLLLPYAQTYNITTQRYHIAGHVSGQSHSAIEAASAAEDLFVFDPHIPP